MPGVRLEWPCGDFVEELGLPSERPCDPPWPAWAAALSRSLGQPGESSGRVARAVAALRDAGLGDDALAGLADAKRELAGLTSDARLDGWLVGLCGLSTRRQAANPPVGPARGAEARLAEGAEAREAAAALSAPALVAGLDPEPWIRLGVAVAAPAALLAGLGRLWLDPALAVYAEGGIPRDLAAAVPSFVETWAGGPELEARADRIRRELSSDGAASRLGTSFEAGLTRAREAAAGATDGAGSGTEVAAGGEVVAQILDGLERAFAWLRSYAAFWGLGRRTLEPSPAARDLVACLDLARRFLLETADWPGSWEVRRCGLAGSEETLVGSWFHRGFVLRALARMGEPCSSRIGALLAEGDPAGLRWFGAFRGIPPDADSLGLALELASLDDVVVDPGRVEGWLGPLVASLDEAGLPRTWFVRGPDGPTQDEPAHLYLGDECTAVRLALARGLLLYAAGRFGDLAERTVDAVLASAGPEGLGGVFFYSAAYAEDLLARLGEAAEERRPGSALASALRAAVEVARAGAAAAQRLDGGWGGPQETAWRLSLLARAGTDAEDLLRAVGFLVETQRPDGSWAAEPFYVMPGVGRAPAWHLGPAMTTAVCAEALATARARLGG